MKQISLFPEYKDYYQDGGREQEDHFVRQVNAQMQK